MSGLFRALGIAFLLYLAAIPLAFLVMGASMAAVLLVSRWML